MAYMDDNQFSYVRGVEIYAAAGTITDGAVLAASAWKNNLLTTQPLVFPHAYNDFEEAYTGSGTIGIYDVYVASLYRVYDGPYPPNYNPLIGRVPLLSSFCARAGSMGVNLQGKQVCMLSGFVSFYSSTAAQNLFIYRVPSSKNVYIYDASLADNAVNPIAYWVTEKANGDILLDTSRPVCMPRLSYYSSSSTGRYAADTIFILGLSDDGYTVSKIADAGMVGLYPYNTTLHNYTFFRAYRAAETYENTIAFLNTWPLNDAERKPDFSPNSFLQGILTAQRLKLARHGTAGGASAVSAGAGGEYEENSFLAGLSAGFAARTMIKPASGLIYELSTLTGDPVFNAEYVTAENLFSPVLDYTEHNTVLAIDTGSRIVIDSAKYKKILSVTYGNLDGLVNTGTFPAEGRTYPITYYALMTPTELMAACGENDRFAKSAGNSVLAEVGDVPCIWYYTKESYSQPLNLEVKVYGDPSKIETTFYGITTSASYQITFIDNVSGKFEMGVYTRGGGASYSTWGTPTDHISLVINQSSGAVTSLTHRAATTNFTITMFNFIQQTAELTPRTSTPAWLRVLPETLGTGPICLSLEGYGSPDTIYRLFYHADLGYITVEDGAVSYLGDTVDGAAFQEHGLTSFSYMSFFTQVSGLQYHAWIPGGTLWGYLNFHAIPTENHITGLADLNTTGRIGQMAAEYTGTVYAYISLDGELFSEPLLMENFLTETVRDQLNEMLAGMADKKLWFRFSLESEDATLTNFRVYG